MNISEAIDELDRAKELLDNSTRLVQYDYIYLIFWLLESIWKIQWLLEVL